jgi:hypothetical protein
VGNATKGASTTETTTLLPIFDEFISIRRKPPQVVLVVEGVVGRIHLCNYCVSGWRSRWLSQSRNGGKQGFEDLDGNESR